AGRHRNGPNLPEGSERERARRTAEPAALWPLLLPLDRFSGDAGTGEHARAGEAQARPSERRGPRACPDRSPPCCPWWRSVVRPLPPSAAFLLGGPEPLRGAPRRAPRAPRRRVRPACGGLALGLRLTVTLFPFQEKPDRFSGDAGTGAPTLASVEKE